MISFGPTPEGILLDEWQRQFERNGESPVIPAATVVVLRDGVDGAESLMLRRNSSIAFGGMWVFPGGRIDPEDYDSSGDLLAAARNAAVREAHEEASLALEPGQLVHFSFWIPPPITPKRFATWFFAAHAPANEVTVDEGEIVHHEWMTPADAMRRRDAGEIELAPPTWVTLHTLSTIGQNGRNSDSGRRSHDPQCDAQGLVAADLLAELDRCDPRNYETRIGLGPQGPVSMWHGDAGYETGDPSVAGPRHRLEMAKDGFRYQESLHT